MKQVRKRLTYANVMSSIAVFLVLGGATAFAASTLGKNTVGSKQIKKNAVTTAKIKNGAVTGAKLKLNSIGKVPSATTADTAKTATSATTAGTADTAKTAATANTANTATNAGNANTVNGLTPHKVNFRFQSDVGNSGPVQVLNAGGLVITATCTAGDAAVTATTSKQDSSMYIDVFESGVTEEFFQEILESGEFDVGDTMDVLAGGGGNNDLSTFEYDANDGSVVTGTINTDEDGALNGCRVTGTAVSG